MIQSGPKTLREHTLMELLVVSTEKDLFLCLPCMRLLFWRASLVAPPCLKEFMWFFQMHMEEPCFDFLRTKETLG